MKKLIFILTALAVFTFKAKAEDFSIKNADGIKIYYTITDNTALTVAVTYKGDDYISYEDEYKDSVNIPSSVTHNKKTYSVTSISPDAFRSCTILTGINIPDCITKIGADAFRSCIGLTSVTIPDGITDIGVNAFYNCTSLSTLNFNAKECNDFKYNNKIFKISPLTTVTIGDNVKRIPAYFLKDQTEITEISIPNSVIEIGAYAFANCSGLTNINIPDGITEIGAYAFYDCTGLTNITIPKNVMIIGAGAFHGCNSLKALNFKANRCTDFNDNIFKNTSLTCVTIGENVNSIPAYFLKDQTEITEITIPNGVSEIGSAAFYGCSGLTNITIPNGITEIGAYAFYDCTGLTNITIPDGITEIGAYAFYDCTGLTNITIPKNVMIIGDGAFKGCNSLNNLNYKANRCIFSNDNIFENSLTTVTIGDSVKYIPNYFFKNQSKITKITIPNSVTEIGSMAFGGCTKLTNITIPEGVSKIGDMTFYKCTELTNINIPNSVTEIGSLAFSSCTGLTSITIPDEVAKIGAFAFSNCSNLNTLYFNAKKCDNFSYSDNIFYGSPLTTVIIGNNVKRIPSYFLKNQSGITEIIIPDGVTEISSSAFHGCNNLNLSNLQSNLYSEENNTNTPRYSSFPTKNMWTFLKLDTSNGRIWQVQYSTKDGSEYRHETDLNPNILTHDGYNGRFTLLPTQNIYNFLLLDQHNGDVYQVQWNIDDDKRMIIPIE